MKKLRKVAKRAKRKVIDKTSDLLAAPAVIRSRRAIRKANEETNILKNDIDNRKRGNWTGSEQQLRTRRMADFIKTMRKKKKK